MKITKTLLLGALTALSIGAGTAAMAQESAGGVGAGPWEQHQFNLLVDRQDAAAATGYAPQYGASDRVTTSLPAPVPQAADGSGS